MTTQTPKPLSERETQTVKIPEVEETTVIATANDPRDPAELLLNIDNSGSVDLIDNFSHWWSTYRRTILLLTINTAIVALVIGLIWNVQYSEHASTPASDVAVETTAPTATDAGVTNNESATSHDILATGQAVEGNDEAATGSVTMPATDETSAPAATADTAESATASESTSEKPTTTPSVVSTPRRILYPEQAYDWRNPYNDGGPLDLDRHEVREHYMKLVKESKKGGKKSAATHEYAETQPRYYHETPTKSYPSNYEMALPHSEYVEILDGEAAREQYKKMNRVKADRRTGRN